MSQDVDDEWHRPIDPLLDSYAPEEIAAGLGERHALYLREARRLLAEGLRPDLEGLGAGIRAETRRFLDARPWLDAPGLAPVARAAEDEALGALQSLAPATAQPSSEPPREPAPAPVARPVRRLVLQPSPTILGNMAVRKKPVRDGLELSWDGSPAVAAWTVQVSVRPDPRGDYDEGEAVTLDPGVMRFVVELDDRPRRIQIVGRARNGRVVRRATASALTLGNAGAQWKRQATAG